jgi:polysaccharide deacetylase
MRKCVPILIALLLAVTPPPALFAEAGTSPDSSAPPTIVCKGDAFVGLPALQQMFGIESDRPQVAAQTIKLTMDGRQWEFLNGGDRVKLPDGREQTLTRPLLIIDGAAYIDQRDASALLGVEVSTTNITFKGKQTASDAVQVVSKYQQHTVEGLSCVHVAIKLTDAVEARTNLHPKGKPVRLSAGSVYLCRRNATVDNIRYLMLTDVGNNPVTYLVKEEDLKDGFAEAKLDDSVWQKRVAWFKEKASGGQALQHGDRPALPKCIAVTVDLCWSLRPLEADFLTNLPSMMPHSGGAPAAIFVSGRWIDQHPTEMETLVSLEQEHRAQLTWGLHSWIHPKAGGFMNDLSVSEVREDTLRLERKLLDWGIVPTVYYRFPGLIHDSARLTTVLDLDLLPIDCESWVAVQGGKHPFGNPIQDASIVLVHGNGNEPTGIARFQTWLAGHSDWAWKSLPEFLPHPASAPNH